LVTRFHQCNTDNELRIFPKVIDSGQRSEQYKKLWVELIKFGKIHSSKKEHLDILNQMQKLTPEIFKETLAQISGVSTKQEIIHKYFTSLKI
jgi:hypothetical protein